MVNLNVKVSLAKERDIDTILDEIHSFNMPAPEHFHFTDKDTVFVAKQGKKILGFAVLFPESPRETEIAGLYLRIGHDRLGIGSKLLGKANAFAIREGIPVMHLSPSTGKYVSGGKIVERNAKEFYKRTNYMKCGLRYFWHPIAKLRRTKRKVRTEPQRNVSPQNILSKDRAIRRRK